MIQFLRNDLANIPDLEILESDIDKKRFSRDFYDYSPVLVKRLENCIADLVVRPHCLEAILSVASFCWKYSVPLTIRGSGTGNYGQSVPLEGGVVMLMGGLRQIRNFDHSNGVVTVEAGCLLKDLDMSLREKGRQLRLLPSTWRSATIGGFIAGGSGGIGSVRWGFLRDPGHLLGIEAVTVNDFPQTIHLDDFSAEALNHAYGTNGIITALTLSTTQAIKWQEIIIDCADWSEAVFLVQEICKSAIELFLCSLLEKDIVNQIPHWLGKPKGKHRILILAAPDGVSTVKRIAKSISGSDCRFLGQEKFSSGNSLRELTWNHTTLHMRSADKNWTYLQMLLPQPELKAMQILKNRWGDNFLWHIEAVRQYGVQRLAALPLVRWKDKQTLDEMINHCKEIGALIFNPHVITVEDGGLGVIDGDQVAAKKNFDPKGILNPGKLKGFI